MFLTGMSRRLKPDTIAGWREKAPRSLSDAAHLAHTIADSEGLPMSRIAPSETWFAESIVRTVPVYGVAGVECAPRRVDELLTLDADYGRGDGIVWRDLRVRRADFAHYLDWLRSVW